MIVLKGEKYPNIVKVKDNKKQCFNYKSLNFPTVVEIVHERVLIEKIIILEYTD